jgi:serine protease Do
MTISLQAWGGAPKISDELEAISQKIINSVVLVRGNRNGMGSGVVWNHDGLIITNHHVATQEGARVQLNNGQSFDAKVIARDVRRDLAALQLQGKSAATPAEIGSSSSLKAGQLVLAVGNPQGERNAVTLGIISSLGDQAHGADKVLQLSLTLRPGNSGGALADLSGKVVGIPNMVMRNGLSLAVPVDVVQRFLQGELGGRLGVGIRWVGLPLSVQEQLSTKTQAGLLLIQIEEGGPAHKAGLVIGDVLLSAEIDGKTLSPQAIAERELLAGKPATLQVLRGGAIFYAQVTPSKG